MNPNHKLKLERTEKILYSLDNLGFATRSQLQQLHDLGSNRNACRVLQGLGEYITYVRDTENVYYLTKAGRELIGSEKIVNKAMQREHIIMRNDIYLYYGCPSYWKPECPLGAKDIKIIPDAFFCKDHYYFLEVDNIQKMVNNRKKIEKYKQLQATGAFQKKFKEFPIVLWYTKSEVRKKRILEDSEGLKTIVLTKEDLR